MRQAPPRVVAWTVDHWSALWRSGLRPGSLSALAFALGCVCLATAVRLLLGEVGPESAAFAPYYSATLVIALVCGWIVASFAALLGGILAYLLFLLHNQAVAGGAAALTVSLGLYAASSMIIIWAAESHRQLMQLLRQQEEFRKLLSDELAHRVKNTLAIVQTIIRYSVRDQPELSCKLCARIVALADTNSVLTDPQSGSSFLGILHRELAHLDISRVHVSGLDFWCRRETAVLLSLLIHELATNATKYGAFATTSGALHLQWSLAYDRVHLEWQESGVADIPQPQAKGFGSKLLETVAKQFNGSAEIELAAGGLKCRLTLRLPELADSATSSAHDSFNPLQSGLPGSAASARFG